MTDFFGGAGPDVIAGTAGADRVMGLAAGDRLSGFDGNDTLDGGEGDDNLLGGRDNDVLIGGTGDDTLDAGSGDDQLDGGDGDDSLLAGAGHDGLVGGDGADWLGGEDGNDTLVGGPGADRLDGGSGADRFVFTPADPAGGVAPGGDDLIFNFEHGIDVIDIAAFGFTDLAQLRMHQADGNTVIELGPRASITLIAVNASSIGASDFLGLPGGAGGGGGRGSVGGGVIGGGAGNDVLIGGASNDSLAGGDGDDSLVGDVGDDQLAGGNGNDTLDGGEGRDTLLGDAGADVLRGGNGGDALAGGAGSDWLEDGADASGDRLFGGAGDDRLVVNDSQLGVSNLLLLGGGADTVAGTPLALDGDIIADFGAEDVIEITGAVLSDMSRLRAFLVGGQTGLSLDTNNDGFFDTSLWLEGLFSPAGFFPQAATTGTLLRYAAPDGNRPPVALDDWVMTPVSQAVVIDVLANDGDGDGALVASSLQLQSFGPLHGSARVEGGRIVYTPAIGFRGEDHLSYTVRDDDGAISNAAAVAVVVGVYANQPPIAANDVALVPFATPTAINVLANDRDADGTVNRIVLTTAPGHGTAVVSGGRVLYTPANGFSGADAFGYQAVDDDGAFSNVATVAVTVEAPANRAPFASDDVVNVPYETPIAFDVLANDGDSDGRIIAVSLVTQPLHGTAVAQGGQIVYTPFADYYGPDQLSYLIADDAGAFSRTAVVTLAIAAPAPLNLTGTAGNDLLAGWDGTDSLAGLAGNDTLDGGLGDDWVDGGSGADRLVGGAGNDTYTFDNKRDVIVENPNEGWDTVVTRLTYRLAANVENASADGGRKIALTGNELANQLTGDGGANRLLGLDGDDGLAGNAGRDALYGGNGNDRLSGGADLDKMYGEGGDDVLIGGGGADQLYGGDGVDVFVYEDVGDSGVGRGLRDTLRDFAHGLDKIDLTALAPGAAQFQFIGDASFTWGAAYQLRLAAGVIAGDINGDASADFEIAIGRAAFDLADLLS